MGLITQMRGQNIEKAQGLLELILKYGSTFPAGELSKKAKELGIPEHMLAGLAEPIFAKPEAFQQRISPMAPQTGAQSTQGASETGGAGEVAGYRIKSEEERKWDTTQRQTMKKARLRLKTAVIDAQTQALIAGTVEAAKQAVMLGKEKELAEVKSGYAKELETLKQKGASDTRFSVANYKHWLQTERIELQDKLRRTPTELEKKKIESEIEENVAQKRYADVLSDWISGGKGEPERELKELWNRLEKLGLLTKIKSGKGIISRIKPVVRNSDDYKQVVEIYKALGVSFEEVNAGKTFPMRKQKVLLIPVKSSQRSKSRLKQGKPSLSPQINLPDPLGFYQ